MKNLILLIPILLVSCSIPDSAYSHITENFDSAKKFKEIFPNSKSKISRFHGFGGPLFWYSKEIIYGKYMITIGIELESNSRSNPNQSDQASVWIEEIKIDKNYISETNPTGIVKSYLGAFKEEQFMSSTGIDELFEFIDFTPIKNAPVEGATSLKEKW